MLKLANAARLKEYLRPLVRGERDDRATIPDGAAKAAWPGDPTAPIAAQALTPRWGAEVDARFLLAVRTLDAVGTSPVGQWHIGSGPMALVARETVSINPPST